MMRFHERDAASQGVSPTFKSFLWLLSCLSAAVEKLNLCAAFILICSHSLALQPTSALLMGILCIHLLEIHRVRIEARVRAKCRADDKSKTKCAVLNQPLPGSGQTAEN